MFEVCTFQNRLALFQPKNVQFSQQNVPVLTCSEPEIENIEKVEIIKSFALFQESVTKGELEEQ